MPGARSKTRRQAKKSAKTVQMRYLLSPEEDQKVRRQLMQLKQKTGHSVSHSCLVRSLLKVYAKHHQKIVKAALESGPEPRPSNLDHRGQEKFEQLISEIIAQGIRSRK